MKTKFLIIFLCCALPAFCQHNYMVYQLKGKVWEMNNKERKLLQTGTLLKNDPELWLDKGATITLICENYNFFTVNTAGKYVLADHFQLCSDEKSSITADYFSFIWEELTHPHQSPEDDRRKYMHNKGAVVRGCMSIIMNHLLDTINYHDGSIFITWKTNLANERISFALYLDEKNDDPIFSTVVKGNSISIDTILKYKRKADEIYWNVNIDGNETCPRKYIRFWNDNDYGSYLDSIKKTVPDNINKAEWYYMMGFLLETRAFPAEACVFYNQAMKLNASSERYKRTATSFKKELGIK